MADDNVETIGKRPFDIGASSEHGVCTSCVAHPDGFLIKWRRVPEISGTVKQDAATLARVVPKKVSHHRRPKLPDVPIDYYTNSQVSFTVGAKLSNGHLCMVCLPEGRRYKIGWARINSEMQAHYPMQPMGTAPKQGEGLKPPVFGGHQP
jgi:hypothetical protein